MRQPKRVLMMITPVAMVLSSGFLCMAQTPQGNLRFTPPVGKKTGKPATQPIHVDQPVDFPGVPKYTGRFKLLVGRKYKNNGLGMTIAVQEESSQVLQWYRDALKAYGWTLNNVNPSQPVVSAVKDSNSFSVAISPAHELGFRSVVNLSYSTGN